MWIGSFHLIFCRQNNLLLYTVTSCVISLDQLSFKIGLFTLSAFQVFAVEAQLLQNILLKLEQNYIVVGLKKNLKSVWKDTVYCT